MAGRLSQVESDAYIDTIAQYVTPEGMLSLHRKAQERAGTTLPTRRYRDALQQEADLAQEKGDVSVAATTIKLLDLPDAQGRQLLANTEEAHGKNLTSSVEATRSAFASVGRSVPPIVSQILEERVGKAAAARATADAIRNYGRPTRQGKYKFS